MFQYKISAYLQQIHGIWFNLWQKFKQISGSMVGKVISEDISIAGPVSLGRSTQHPEDPGQLVRLIEAGKQRFSADQLCQNTATGPNIYRGRVRGSQ